MVKRSTNKANYEPNASSHSESGAAMVETAISILVFMSLLVLTVDVMRMSYAAAAAQFTVSDAIRAAAIDQSITQASDLIDLTQRYAGNGGVGIHGGQHNGQEVLHNPNNPAGISGYQIYNQNNPDPRFEILIRNSGNSEVCSLQGTCQSGAIGKERDLVFLQISFPFRFFYGMFEFEISAAAFSRNEPEAN
jgi:hypothetical protein